MNNHIIFLSVRQLWFLDFNSNSIKNSTLSLILSKEEFFKLSNDQKSLFSNIKIVPVVSRDNILSVYDTDSVISIISEITTQEQSLSIICFDEGNIVVAASCRQFFSLKGSSPELALLFRDKILMKEKLAKDNIRVPHFTRLQNSSCNDFKKLKHKIGIPFIIKPISSAGSNCISVIRNEEDYFNAFKKIEISIENYEAEEFIQGALYHCDLAYFNGNIVFSECTRYLAATIDFQEGTPLGGTILELTNPIRKKLISFTSAAISSLGGTDGVFHTEIFINDADELIFLESGYRPPGMLVTKMYEQATGINLLNLDVVIQMGSFNEKLLTYKRQRAFYLVYPKYKGTVLGVNKAPQHTDLFIDYNCYAQCGDIHKGCFSNLDFIATVVCSGVGEDLNAFYKEMAKYHPADYSF